MILWHKNVLIVLKINLFLMGKDVLNVLKISSSTKQCKNVSVAQLDYILIKVQNLVNAKNRHIGMDIAV